MTYKPMFYIVQFVSLNLGILFIFETGFVSNAHSIPIVLRMELQKSLKCFGCDIGRMNDYGFA